MGAPMAGHLLTKGHDLVVWNRTATKADALVADGASRAESLADLAPSADLVILCVGTTEDVGECLAEMAPHARPETTFVDHSTISPEGAIRFHRDLGERGMRFIDAPITGGSMGAINGTLTVFCGGDERVIETVKPVLAAYSKRVERVGGPGSGQTMKAANQIAVAGALLGLCESLAFAANAGLDLSQTRDLLSGGAAGSWAFENYGPKILNSDWSPGFSVKNQRKDLRYCLEAATDQRMELPGTALVDELLATLSAEGRGEEATAALFEVLRRRKRR
ncbi:MAG: 2-hydroxy-3-oxopropionate reductase [Fimbriimonadaceae bacterium]|nr:2-hydroxy-3-oxopropionate reductase [Fimbriimonadaceae bacterium]